MRPDQRVTEASDVEHLAMLVFGVGMPRSATTDVHGGERLCLRLAAVDGHHAFLLLTDLFLRGLKLHNVGEAGLPTADSLDVLPCRALESASICMQRVGVMPHVQVEEGGRWSPGLDLDGVMTQPERGVPLHAYSAELRTRSRRYTLRFGACQPLGHARACNMQHAM